MIPAAAVIVLRSKRRGAIVLNVSMGKLASLGPFEALCRWSLTAWRSSYLRLCSSPITLETTNAGRVIDMKEAS